MVVSFNRSALSLILSTLNGIASAIQDGEYDSSSPREAEVCKCVSVSVCVSVCLCVCERECVHVCTV